MSHEAGVGGNTYPHLCRILIITWQKIQQIIRCQNDRINYAQKSRHLGLVSKLNIISNKGYTHPLNIVHHGRQQFNTFRDTPIQLYTTQSIEGQPKIKTKLAILEYITNTKFNLTLASKWFPKGPTPQITSYLTPFQPIEQPKAIETQGTERGPRLSPLTRGP